MSIFVAELVIQAVFSTDKRCAVSHSHVLTADRSTNKGSQSFRTLRVSPAEVIEDCDAIGISPDSDAVSNGLINGAGRHPIGVLIAEVRIDSARYHKTTTGIQIGANNSSVGRPIVMNSDQRFDHAASLNFMIILANDPLFTGNI